MQPDHDREDRLAEIRSHGRLDQFRMQRLAHFTERLSSSTNNRMDDGECGLPALLPLGEAGAFGPPSKSSLP